MISLHHNLVTIVPIKVLSIHGNVLLFYLLCATTLQKVNHIGSVMVSVLASSAVDRGFKPRSGQTKDHEIGICCSSTKHTALRRKSKDWLAQNQDNVFERGDMSSHGLLVQ
jgi:hypothetical protein